MPISNGPTKGEQRAADARAKVCDKAVREYCEKKNIPFVSERRTPVIGIALSGGGWRSMLSSAAFLDALSEVGLLDGVTYVAGLSGGSWCVFQYLLSQKDFNPFHGLHPDQPEGTAIPNPWIAGLSFQPNLHGQYRGLIRMLSVECVEKAARQGQSLGDRMIRTMMEALNPVLDDVTIPSVLLDKKMGEGYVERWANFLADDLLSWKSKDPTSLHLPTPDEDSTLSDGSKPILICSAISSHTNHQRVGSSTPTPPVSPTTANRSGTPQDGYRADDEYEWVEFTPYGSRHYHLRDPETEGAGQHEDGWEILRRHHMMGNLRWPTTGWPKHSDQQSWGALIQRDPALAPIRKPPADPAALQKIGYVPLHLHHLMAICGSAFAFDIKSMIEGLPGTRLFVSSESKCLPVLGGTTRVPGLGVLRDGGICFNVPFPALLSNPSGRQVDILLVMDAGEGSDGCGELLKAKAYYEISQQTQKGCPDFPKFPPHCRARVFTPANTNLGLPVIIYFLGITDRPTTRVKLDPWTIRRDCEKVRSYVRHQLLPLLDSIIGEFGKPNASLTTVTRTVSAEVLTNSPTFVPPRLARVASRMKLQRVASVFLNHEGSVTDPYTEAKHQLETYAGSWLKSLMLLAMEQPNVLDNPFEMMFGIDEMIKRTSVLRDYPEKELAISRVLHRKALEALTLRGTVTSPFTLNPQVEAERTILGSNIFMGALLVFCDPNLPREFDMRSDNDGTNTVRFSTALFGAYHAALHYGSTLTPTSTRWAERNIAPDYPFSEFHRLDGEEAFHVWLLLCWICQSDKTAAEAILAQLKVALRENLKLRQKQLVALSSASSWKFRDHLSQLLGLPTVIIVLGLLHPNDTAMWLLGEVKNLLVSVQQERKEREAEGNFIDLDIEGILSSFSLMAVEAAAFAGNQTVLEAMLPTAPLGAKAQNWALGAAIAGRQERLVTWLVSEKGAVFSAEDAIREDQTAALEVFQTAEEEDRNVYLEMRLAHDDDSFTSSFFSPTVVDVKSEAWDVA